MANRWKLNIRPTPYDRPWNRVIGNRDDGKVGPIMKRLYSYELWLFSVLAAVAPIVGWQLSVEWSAQLLDRGPLTVAFGVYMVGFLALFLLYVLAVGLRLLALMFEGVLSR